MTGPELVGGSRIVGIAAVADNGVIGAGNDIPWRIPADWRRFKALTLGHVLVMGRKTFDSIGRALPGRTTFVVTRDRRWRADGVRVLPDVDEALDQAVLVGAGEVGGATVFVAGGGEVYRAAWDRLTELEITEVHQNPAGDVRFPSVDPAVWTEQAREDHDGFSFVGYRRTTS